MSGCRCNHVLPQSKVTFTKQLALPRQEFKCCVKTNELKKGSCLQEVQDWHQFVRTHITIAVLVQFIQALVPNIVHEAGISLLGNERLRDGSYSAISFLMHCVAFSELLEFQTFFFKSHHVLMFSEQVDLEARRYHLPVWLLITDHWASFWACCIEPRNKCS